MRGHSFVLTLLIIAQIAPALAQSDEASKLERLVQAYPDELATYESGFIVWRDGTKMPVSDGKLQKTFDERLRNASILDQMLLAYPAGPLAQPPGPQDDPGRFRNEAFFDKMYGNCEKGEVQKHLVTIAWLPKSSGAKVKVTTVNEVADKLRAISAEIEALPESYGNTHSRAPAQSIAVQSRTQASAACIPMARPSISMSHFPIIGCGGKTRPIATASLTKSWPSSSVTASYGAANGAISTRCILNIGRNCFPSRTAHDRMFMWQHDVAQCRPQKGKF